MINEQYTITGGYKVVIMPYKGKPPHHYIMIRKPVPNPRTGTMDEFYIETSATEDFIKTMRGQHQFNEWLKFEWNDAYEALMQKKSNLILN